MRQDHPEQQKIRNIIMTNHLLYIQVTGSREIGDAHRTQDKDPTGPAGHKVSMIMVMMVWPKETPIEGLGEHLNNCLQR